MRAETNGRMRWAGWIGLGSLAGLALGLVVSPLTVQAARGRGLQQGRTSPTVTPVPPSFPAETANRSEESSASERLETVRQKVFVDERRKRIVADTDRLLQLATELKNEVTVTTKNELSIGVIKKAGDIEKLAHDVKERMRQ